MNKGKRIYYVPGLITLFFLPLLIVLKNRHEIKNTKQYCIEYFTFVESAKKYYTYEIPAKRNFINVEIDGNPKNDSLHFLFIKNFAQAIDQSKDTMMGIKIVFHDSIKYGTFIETINNLLKAKCQTFIPFEDTIFVYYMHRTDSCPNCNVPNDWSCYEWNFFRDDCRTDKERRREHWLELKNKYIFHMHYWPIFLVYILLVVLAIRKIIK